MTPDQKRILETRSDSTILQLWWSLQPLRSVVRFMNTGAHPDDETTAMLAALGFRDGINLSYACSTRGEGGQNDIGTEAGADLGALRTAEMERAAEVLGMRLYWLSESAADTITDFGFSKSGQETLEKWGRERTLRRFVEIVRADRPDVICPTFLDVPGQHGHHRAMTALAHEVFEVAADPAFVTPHLAPWAVSKLYLPAWSGAGTSYDDDLPPPPATLTIAGQDVDPVSGWGWGLIGEQSRVFHRTQAMGRWAAAKTQRDWELHLAARRTDSNDHAVASGLPAKLADLAGPGDAIATDLQLGDDAVERAFAAFPDTAAVSACLKDALLAVRAAMAACPDQVAGQIVHRLTDKERQISRALRIALGITAHAAPSRRWITRGDRCQISKTLDTGRADAADIVLLPEPGWEIEDPQLQATGNAPLPSGYRAVFDPLDPPEPAIAIRYRTGDIEAEDRIAFENAPVALPEQTVDLADTRAVINLHSETRSVRLQLSGVEPDGGAISLDVPEGWLATKNGEELEIVAPQKVAPGLYRLPVLVDEIPAHSVRRITYDHIAHTARCVPAAVTVRVLSVKVPAVRVGYIGGGNDRVAHWLKEIGANVTDLSGRKFEPSTFSEFDSIVIGIFAMKSSPGLSDALETLHNWVREGGTLVTLYHRPWDNWNSERTPLFPLEIGQPSLRWRVTDESAKVSCLVPDHPLLNAPNQTGRATWDDWVKERGLYFAKSWDAAYVPLLEMADPGEKPHHGALLAADAGKGRHVHTSLILHHQMERLVPGGFELMCNLIARRN